MLKSLKLLQRTVSPFPKLSSLSCPKWAKRYRTDPTRLRCPRSLSSGPACTSSRTSSRKFSLLPRPAICATSRPKIGRRCGSTGGAGERLCPRTARDVVARRAGGPQQAPAVSSASLHLEYPDCTMHCGTLARTLDHDIIEIIDVPSLHGKGQGWGVARSQRTRCAPLPFAICPLG